MGIVFSVLVLGSIAAAALVGAVAVCSRLIYWGFGCW
jgi:hypothetical protein